MSGSRSTPSLPEGTASGKSAGANPATFSNRPQRPPGSQSHPAESGNCSQGFAPLDYRVSEERYTQLYLSRSCQNYVVSGMLFALQPFFVASWLVPPAAEEWPPDSR